MPLHSSPLHYNTLHHKRVHGFVGILKAWISFCPEAALLHYVLVLIDFSMHFIDLSMDAVDF